MNRREKSHERRHTTSKKSVLHHAPHKFAVHQKVSSLRKIKALVELTRPQNCIMAFIAILIGFFIATGVNASIGLIAAVSGLFVCAGGQAINDYFDAKIDAKSSSHRPVPSGRVTRKEAVLFSAGLFILGVGLASSINTLAFLIATIFAILLIAYPLYMNKVKYFGNVIVSLGTAVTFIYGAAATGNIPLLIVVLAIAAFFSNMAREVTKDIQDVKKDTGAKRTLPMILGIENAKSFVTWYYILAIIISLGAAYYFKLNYGYLFFAFLGAIIFSQAQRQLNQNRPTKSQKTSKLGMLISLIAFIMAGFK